jgi:hypothetical protein
MPSDFTPNNVWGSNAPEGSEEELTLPSGQTCRARKVTVTSLIEAGVLNEADSLTAMVDQHTRRIKGGKGVPDGTVAIDQSIMRDSSTIKAMIMMADRTLPAIVVSPPVALHFKDITVGKTTVTKSLPESERNAMRLVRPGLIFTDQIDLEDKMHLFEWGVGGLKAFSSFRADTPNDVGSVVPVSGGKGSAKRRPRNR